MSDRPFEYRGFMLDASRHFMPAENVKRLIDAARLCGMNRMHFHLTDDQGWRIEIRKYPRLTEYGAQRGESIFGGTDFTENNNGFYTQDEIRSIVAYAGKNGIEVIPEIEMPGHSAALLAACPEAGCRRTLYSPESRETGETARWKYAVRRHGGIFPDLVCAGRDEVICFLEDILDEIMELFPYPAVHIGGDEAIKLHWRRCPDCRRRMREKELASEDALQRWMVLEIGEYLASRGRKTIVWNDVLTGGLLPEHFIIQQWKDGEQETRDFLKSGGQIILSDTRWCYFDYPYGQTDLRTIYNAPRIPDYAQGFEGQILGIECPLWTERVTNLERACYQLFPRLAGAGVKALSTEELTWEAYLAQTREICEKIKASGLKVAPEEYWDMTKKAAEADRKADHDRRHTPETELQWKRQNLIMQLEENERRMREEHMPEGKILAAGDLVLAEADMI